MKPPKFDYHAPKSVDEALALLARYGGDAKVLAGGQSLMPLLNFRLEPSRRARRHQPDRHAGVHQGSRRAGAPGRHDAPARRSSSRRSSSAAAAAREATRWVGHLPIRTAARSAAHRPCRSVGRVPGGAGGARGRGRRAQPPRRARRPGRPSSSRPSSRRISRRTRCGRGRLPRCRPARATRSRSSRGATATSRSSASRRWSCATGGDVHDARLRLGGGGARALRLRAAEESLERDGLGEAAIAAAARRGLRAVAPDSDIHASARLPPPPTGVPSAARSRAHWRRGGPMAEATVRLTRQRRARARGGARRASCSRTSCARTSGSPARTSDASTASAARARSWSTARPRARA